MIRTHRRLPTGDTHLRVSLIDAPIAVRSNGHFELARDRDGLGDLNDGRVFQELK
jgi:hypothetical protein